MSHNLNAAIRRINFEIRSGPAPCVFHLHHYQCRFEAPNILTRHWDDPLMAKLFFDHEFGVPFASIAPDQVFLIDESAA